MAWAETHKSIETRVALECEREHQEHLLLSVMPAYIAAEVIINISTIQTDFLNYKTFVAQSKGNLLFLKQTIHILLFCQKNEKVFIKLIVL